MNPPPTKLTKFHTGWKPSDMKPAKFMFQHFLGLIPATIPDAADLSGDPANPPIWDQGQLGSCVVHGVRRASEFARSKQGLDFFGGSRLFMYFNGRRKIEGVSAADDDDTGLTITDGVKSAREFGAPPEIQWPYIISRFKQEPPADLYDEAVKDEVIDQYAINSSDPTEWQRAIAAGYPIVFGFNVKGQPGQPATIENLTAENPVLDVPAPGDVIQGGHCVVCVGYDKTKKLYKMANSWGLDFAQAGYFFMTEAFLVSEDVSDAWVLTKTTVPAPSPEPTPDPVPVPTPDPVPAPTPNWFQSIIDFLEGLFEAHSPDAAKAIEALKARAASLNSMQGTDAEKHESLALEVRNHAVGLRDSLVNLAVEAVVVASKEHVVALK